METNYLAIFMHAFLDGIPVALGVFATAFQMQPWPFIAFAALLAIGAFMPARKRRTRRAY